VIGHYGDRIGRKSMLVLTLVIMGVATFGIGLLPTYARIGPWAAVVLVILRLAQGFGVGGEWGGAVLMAVEHAPSGKRGFYGSWPQIGVPAGLLLSTAVFAWFARLPEDQFLSWGWRVPFLLSIVLVVVGLIIRLRILETPAFERLKASRTESRRPVVELLRTQRKEVLLAMGARLAENGAFYIYSVFSLVYGTQKVGMNRQLILNAVLLGSACGIFAIPFFGAMSDRLGRRPVYLFGASVTALFAYPMFGCSTRVPHGWCGWRSSSRSCSRTRRCTDRRPRSCPELFGTRVRYSGASLGSQLSSVIAGGLSPFIATALLPYGRGRTGVVLGRDGTRDDRCGADGFRDATSDDGMTK
jgi:MFS family permease